MAAAPLVIPVLPVETFIKYNDILEADAALQTERLATGQLPQHFADRFGWESMVAKVASVYEGLPPEEQSKSCILTGNYGQAGAINLFGEAYGLPKVISGHNNYYLWGPGDCSGEVVITVGLSSYDLRGAFNSVTPAGSTNCEYCMPNEDMRPIYVCRDPKATLEQAWSRLKWFE